MSINAISSAMYANVYYNSSLDSILPKQLIERLIALGIDPSTVKSAQEAIKIIQNIEESGGASTDNSSFSSSGKGNYHVAVDNSSPSLASVNSSSALFDRLKQLGQKVGVNIDENEELDKLVEIVQKAIDELFIKAADSNDKNFYLIVCGYQYELNGIILDAENLHKKTQSPDTYLDLLGKYNKAAIQINKREDKNIN